ncbi:MBL fold metallo-hydrolase [Hahella ganghwensis]|uniref:MBL fold metallo-hydrolase n=1 Tax=Hahella ganghwensis TaxID=286420 RepID=UPI0003804371|nr:MBL fold metallo-hydrolase [Hahella ganghwensis]
MTPSLKRFAAVTALALSTAIASFSMTSASAADLKIDVYNPGKASLFPVSSTLVTGPTEAVLIDAQFQRNDAQAVLKMIKDSGKELKTIYISHGDPDFYFGLDVITDAYPQVEVLASPKTVAHIEDTVERKLSYWGPILGENAPLRTQIPKEVTEKTLTVDGKKLEIIGLQGKDPKHTFVWIPSLRTVAGGVVVYENVHVWMADNQTAKSRELWLNTLENLLALNPETIVPGHYLGESEMNRSAVSFTQSYIRIFEDEAIKAPNAAELTEKMTGHFPEFTNSGDLELGAKVIKGEMQWP